MLRAGKYIESALASLAQFMTLHCSTFQSRSHKLLLEFIVTINTSKYNQYGKFLMMAKSPTSLSISAWARGIVLIVGNFSSFVFANV